MNEEDKDEAEEPSGQDGAPQLIVPAKVGLFRRLRNYLLAGIIVVAPIGITIYLTKLVIDLVDAQITPLIPDKYNPETYLPFSIPGLGLLVVLAFLALIGFVTANLFGRFLIHTGERLVNRMPVVRSVYGALKQIVETVLQHSSTSFRQVVMLEYPRRGIWALAFVTSATEGEVQRRTEDELVSVFSADHAQPHFRLPAPRPQAGPGLPRHDCRGGGKDGDLRRRGGAAGPDGALGRARTGAGGRRTPETPGRMSRLSPSANI